MSFFFLNCVNPYDVNFKYGLQNRVVTTDVRGPLGASKHPQVHRPSRIHWFTPTDAVQNSASATEAVQG